MMGVVEMPCSSRGSRNLTSPFFLLHFISCLYVKTRCSRCVFTSYVSLQPSVRQDEEHCAGTSRHRGCRKGGCRTFVTLLLD